MKKILVITLLILTVSLSFLPKGNAQQNTPGCPTWDAWYGTWRPGSTVRVRTEGLNDTYSNAIYSAMNEWMNSGAPVTFSSWNSSQPQGPFMEFKIGSIPDTPPNVTVAKITKTIYDSEGYLAYAEITLDPNKKMTNTQGQLVNVLSDPRNIKFAAGHEMGHTNGLGHHPEKCGQQTSPSIMNRMCGLDSPYISDTLTDCDKAGVKQSYFPTSGGGFGGEPEEPCSDTTGDHQGCGFTPVLIDVLGDGISLSSKTKGVVFDIRAEGMKAKIGWTELNSDDAFLVLDRNNDGKITDGSELFGSVTPQPDRIDKNGFRALAEFDKAINGGNLDGEITIDDRVYNYLRLWRDRNHNGISEPEELQTLASLNVVALELDFKESKRIDRYGNQFRYRAKVKGSNESTISRWAWDVILSH